MRTEDNFSLAARARSAAQVLVVAAIMFVPTGLAIAGQPIAVTTFVAACLVLGFLLIRFDAIEEITFGPLKAKLQRRIDEAEALLVKIRESAVLAAEANISSLVRMGRWSGYDVMAVDAIRQKFVDLLGELGVDARKIHEVQNDWLRYNKFDYVMMITGGSTTPRNATPTEAEDWKRLRDIDNLPTPDALRRYLVGHGALTPSLDDLLNDYSEFVRTGKHPRLEVFASSMQSREPLTFTVDGDQT